MSTKNITAVRKRDRIGVNRDGQPIGHAVRIAEDRWTAFVYTTEPPFDFAVTGLVGDAAAVAYIAAHGVTPPHLKVAAMRER